MRYILLGTFLFVGSHIHFVEADAKSQKKDSDEKIWEEFGDDAEGGFLSDLVDSEDEFVEPDESIEVTEEPSSQIIPEEGEVQTAVEPMPTLPEEKDGIATEQVVEFKDKPVLKKESVKSAMRTLKRNCNMRTRPSLSGRKIKVSKRGTKMWTIPQGNKWFKIKRRKGSAFISQSCF